MKAPLIATHETSFQRWSGNMDRYFIHAYGLFPFLGKTEYGDDPFLKYLRGRFMQTDFSKVEGEVLAHAVHTHVNPPCGGYGKPGLLEPWGSPNVPLIDAMELGLCYTEQGAYIPRMQWPAHVLAEWAKVQAEEP